MWVLAIQDRQYWLLPGRQYIIGRTTKNAENTVDIVIQESSVSRKHLVLEVVAATEDAILHPSIRSELYITDLASRFGTALDGHALPANDKTVVPHKASDSVTLKIGSVVVAKLKWKNFVVSYATGQSGEAHETIWNHALDMLKPLDVKLLPYIVKKTSVLVKAGATTSTVYFALASCIAVVNSQFLQALHDAAMEASSTGVKGSIIPDMKPFNPDPLWRPDPRRAKCLAGQSFHSPDQQHAAVLRPIIEAAGGLYSDGSDENTIWVCQNDADPHNLAAGTQYVDLTAVFSAISHCRGVEPADIHKTIDPVRSKRPNTNEYSSSEPKKQKLNPSISPVQTQSSGRPRRERVNFFSALTSSQPPSSQAPAQQGHPSQPAIPTVQSHPSSETGSNHDSNTMAQPRTQQTQQPNLNTVLPSSKAEKRPKEDVPARKRTRRNTPKVPPQPSEADIAPLGEPEPEEDDIAISDYSTIGELAIVDASMDTTRDKHSSQPVQTWSGRPNFKGFKKSSRVNNMRRVDYDADIPDDTPLDDEFAAPTPSPSTSSSLRQALRAGTPVGRELEQNSDESLFVSSNSANDFGTLESTNTRRGLARDLSGDLTGDDDGFSFRFS